jgi:hypothetical protein
LHGHVGLSGAPPGDHEAVSVAQAPAFVVMFEFAHHPLTTGGVVVVEEPSPPQHAQRQD